MSNEQLIVPTHPTVSDYHKCRRSSCIDTSSTRTSPIPKIKPMVVPLMSSTIKATTSSRDTSTVGGFMNSNPMKIDAAAISVAVNAARQQIVYGTTKSTASSSDNKFINRRGSLDVNVEYAVAMVNIIDPIYDMDNRDMCAFGTRRDSVCGGNTGGSKESPRPRRRILKKKPTDDDDNNDSTNHVLRQQQQILNATLQEPVVPTNDDEITETTTTTAATTDEEVEQ